MDPTTSYRLDSKQQLARQIRSLPEYATAAAIPEEIGRRLAEQLSWLKLAPARIVDLGCARGHLLEPLRAQFPQAGYVGVEPLFAEIEPAPGTIKRWLNRAGTMNRICASPEALPLASETCELLTANLVIPRCAAPPDALEEWHRVLAPGGFLMLTTLGPDTLVELRACFSSADERPVPRVHTYPDMHDLGDVLASCGYTDVVMETERLTLAYPTFAKLTQDLRALGATNALLGRPRTLLGKARYRRALEHYESYRTDGTLPATVEVVYAHARKPDGSARPGRQPVEVTFD